MNKEKYYSYNTYDDIEIWYGDKDKGKFIMSTSSDNEADRVENELNKLLSGNRNYEKENKQLKKDIADLEMSIILKNDYIECLKEENRKLKDLQGTGEMIKE